MPVGRLVKCVLIVAPLLALGGCKMVRAVRNKACHEPQPYMKATSVPPLVIPAGLDAPDSTNALRLPGLNEPGPPPRTGKQPCLDEPPPYKVAQPARTPQA